MLNQHTLERLRKLRLDGMADAFASQMQDTRFDDLSFAERFGMVLGLASGDWIRSHHNVLIEGPTGSGKTYLACALANAACRQGFSARYYRVPRLIAELSVAKGDGSYPRLLGRLSRTQVLVLDDWGLAPFSAVESRDILEVIEDRCESSSTIVASQLSCEHWHSAICDPSVDRNVLAAGVDRALNSLVQLNLVRFEKQDSGVGRPTERWFAVVG